ncbi:unnamed protein product [Moneuplotes crassus]|uniref:Uncharacterized protein n=1 Tax=Euplotes crassus TaxID=5936 RepID=A0AAD2D6Z1_EUPCR|nr:unnamed protein product [Moneuplotes crassus]
MFGFSNHFIETDAQEQTLIGQQTQLSIFSEDDPDSPKIPECVPLNIPELPELERLDFSPNFSEISANIFNESPKQNDIYKFQEVRNCKVGRMEGGIDSFELSNTQITQTQLVKSFELKESKQKNSTGTSKPSRSRWGRKQDKLLFQTIRDMEKEELITMNDLLTPSSEIFSRDCEEIQQLCERSGWKSSPEKLLSRIKSLCVSEFSFRETTLLKKILKTYKYKEVDYQKVINEFPGKTMPVLQSMAQMLIDFHCTKDLDSFRNSRKKSVRKAPK